MKKFTQVKEINENSNYDQFKYDIATLYVDINIINYLQDEGYLDGPYLIEGITVEDVNHVLINEFGLFDDLLKSPEDAYKFCMNTLSEMGEFSRKYLMEFK